MFKNKASFPYSMHPHGVVYAKNAEGAAYNDGKPWVTDSHMMLWLQVIHLNTFGMQLVNWTGA